MQRVKSKRRKFNGVHMPIVIDPDKLHDDDPRMGRPSKYLENPEFYCISIVFHMSQGMTKEAASIQMGIWPATIWNWEQKGKEAIASPKEERTEIDDLWVNFLNALKRGETVRQVWWEEQGRRGIRDKDFNSTLWMMNMSNMFRASMDTLRGVGWTRDSSKLEISGNVVHTPSKINLNNFNKEEKELFLDLVRKATTETVTL